MAPTKHVAVLAFPFGSHASPLLTLIRKLSESAPHLHFSFLSTAKSNASIFKEPISNIKPYNVNDGLPESYVPGNGGGGNHLEMVELFLNEAPKSFKKGMEAATAESGEEIGYLISDGFFWFARDMGRDMNVPWLPVWTSGPRPLLLHVETDLIWQKIESSGFRDESQSLDFLPGFSAVHVSDLPQEVVSRNLDSPFANMLYKMGHYLPLATAVIINSFEELDPEMLNAFNSRFQKFLNIGPFNILPPTPSLSDEHGCLPWLDKQGAKTVVYISFSIFLSPPPHEVLQLAEALEESGCSFLWSFRGNVENDLPKGFVERGNGSGKGKIVPWAPQLKVLQHCSVSVFVTHGGWNSVLESIAGGVPMIGRPFFGDQGMNMKTVEDVWGIGVGLEGGVITKSGVLKALELVLASEKGKEMREKVGVLQGLAHKAVESTGSSSRNLNSLVELVTN